MSNGKPTPSKAFDGPGRIDVHHHCFPGTVDELQSEFENNSYNLNYTPFPKTPGEHLKYMDEVGIQTAVIVREYTERLTVLSAHDTRLHPSSTSGTMTCHRQNLSFCAKGLWKLN